MRCVKLIVLIGGVNGMSALATANDAAAFGDRCFDPITVRGQVAGSMRAAWASAESAWESAAARRHGSRYANWSYSADRTFDCSWNIDGNRIRCTAEATPCGRK
jgi:hypothetical protein